MYVSEFANRVAIIAEEVGCDGAGNILSHKTGSSVTVIMEDDEFGDYELVDVEPSMMMGCGCWDGVVLTIKRTRTAKANRNILESSDGAEHPS